MSTDTPFSSKDFATLVKDLLEFAGSGSGGRTALTDVTEGSVVRTLLEAFARELAVCYEQLDIVYRYGYLDTAEASALDNVVALLGMTRRRAGHVEGSVLFSRNIPTPDDINIPAGTLVAGRDVQLFETARSVTLPSGGTDVIVDIRSVEPGGDNVPAGGLSVMPRPILGIEGVTNPGELVLRQREETDSELRERARHILEHNNLGTVPALAQAVRSTGLHEVQILDAMPDRPGEVEVILGDPDISLEHESLAREAVLAVRPAGIRVTVKAATRIWVELKATLELDQNYPEHEKQAIAGDIEQKLAAYFDDLGIGERVRWTKVRNLLTSHLAVTEVHALQDAPFMTTWVDPGQGEDGGPHDRSPDYRLRNGDLRLGVDERAGVDRQRWPIQLALEPPAVDLWVDVAITIAAGQTRPADDAVRNALKLFLDDLANGVDSGERDSVTHGEFAAFLRQQNIVGGHEGEAVTVRLTHDRDGREVELSGPDDSDPLGKRERPTLRHLLMGEAGTGEESGGG